MGQRCEMSAPDPPHGLLPGIGRQYTEMDSRKEFFSLAYDAMPVGVALGSTTGEVVYANPAFLAMTECTAEELPEMGLPMVCAMFGITTTPELLEKAPQAKNAWHGTERHIFREDGSRAWFRVHLATMAAPGGGTLIQLMVEDVTRYRELMDFFHHRHRRYAAVFEKRLDPICHFLPDWSILFANTAYCRYFGRKRRDIVGESFLLLLSLEDRQRFIDGVCSLSPENPVIEVEHQLIWVETRALWLRWTIHASFYKTGHLKECQAVGVDISDHKLAEERFMHADRLISLGTLVSGVAHEINNPNNFIMLNAPLARDLWNKVARLLEEQAGQGLRVDGVALADILADVPQLLDGIVEGGTRIRDIVKELKEYARYDDRRGFDPVSINEVVQSALALMSKTIRSHTNRLSVCCADHLPLVKGHPQRLEQVVVNLVHNACLALGDVEQALAIETFYHEPTLSVRIAVRDQGVGISPEDLPSVTEPFYSTRRGEGGTGLGLSISQKIVKEHGGRLLIESSPGAGTSAVVILPVAL